MLAQFHLDFELFLDLFVRQILDILFFHHLQNWQNELGNRISYNFKIQKNE